MYFPTPSFPVLTPPDPAAAVALALPQTAEPLAPEHSRLFGAWCPIGTANGIAVPRSSPSATAVCALLWRPKGRYCWSLISIGSRSMVLNSVPVLRGRRVDLPGESVLEVDGVGAFRLSIMGSSAALVVESIVDLSPDDLQPINDDALFHPPRKAFRPRGLRAQTLQLEEADIESAPSDAEPTAVHVLENRRMRKPSILRRSCCANQKAVGQ